ncbi:hypothetical protein FHW69_002219 [Luteibacter sp. Sphag1AF]|uniref:DUF3757 domain-containing protein n=1 Tax=Luteibacter sp. Sphag1AF TaxID=2587031 RepID=UPI00161A9ACD|nr:DUF3757 domain-containing protein [Luteibacter sp. Sphag1AF]MBB3227596.1 hypothetical protein [Luteibacter sp. Sphag1AF]
MNVAKSLTALLCLTGCPLAFAQAVEHCPRPENISRYGGVYIAKTHAQDHEWLGIASNGNNGRVMRFNEATFYPDTAESTQGEIAGCTYKLENGSINIAFVGKTSERPKVILSRGNAWTRESGPFGIPYDSCAGDDAARCAFQIVQK